jgi:TetR/AcrR family transcriptional regulator, cholesterol catabolism regulator
VKDPDLLHGGDPNVGAVATTPEPETLTANQAARRERVLEAAMQLAADGGYDAVQMRSVASTANVALGTIYRYFTSKDHLLAAALVSWATDLQHRIEQRPPRGDTLDERVVDVLRRATRAIERNPQLAAAMVTAITSPDPAVQSCQREMSAVLAAVISAPLADAPADLRDGAVRVLSHVWFSALVGWVNGWGNVGDVGDELETAARLLLER